MYKRQLKGSVNVQLAEKTGFSEEDAQLLKEALKTLFENDASSARPEGSMEVCRLYWWQHEEKMPAVSTAKVHRSVKIEKKTDHPRSFNDYDLSLIHIYGIGSLSLFTGLTVYTFGNLHADNIYRRNTDSLMNGYRSSYAKRYFYAFKSEYLSEAADIQPFLTGQLCTFIPISLFPFLDFLLQRRCV